jgi:GNAT superfamily N-acetyltransferase
LPQPNGRPTKYGPQPPECYGRGVLNPSQNPAPELLERHLEEWLGAWPPTNTGVTVVGSPKRSRPGWDGKIHDVIGVETPTGAVLSVPEHAAERVAAIVGGTDVAADIDILTYELAHIVGREGHFSRGVFRWSDSPTRTPDIGEWVPTNDKRVPEWLHPFNDEVLIAWDDAGNYGAGVGLKKHDRFGQEISVGTETTLRGRGIARQLVATAARRILREGAIATYLHDSTNYASAKVANAAGFPDRGWKILGLWS